MSAVANPIPGEASQSADVAHPRPGAVRVVIDTNVWVDYFDGSRKGHGTAMGLLDALIDRDAMILYPVHIVKDVYYIVATVLKRQVREERGAVNEAEARSIEEVAWECAMNMRELATAVGADESDLWLAEKNHRLHRDLEDDLVIAAAMRAHADYLVTSDARLIAHSPVAALVPTDMLAYLEDAS